MLKIAELKQGMICELRNGNPFIVSNTNTGRKFYNDRLSAFFKLSDDYNDDLTHQSQKDYDIMKVSYGDKVLFERVESNLFFEPKKGENFHYIKDAYINTYGNNSEYDNKVLRTHIVFKTREEAEKELSRQQARIRVIKEIARLNDGWDVNKYWENQYIEKYYIAYYHEVSELTTNYNRGFKYMDNNLYLKTRELAEQLIETHSDDLKLMLEVE